MTDLALYIPSALEVLLSAPESDRGKLQRIAYHYLREKQERGEIPTSIRFLFYELEQDGILSKKQEGKRKPAQNLTEAVTWLREKEDDTRTLHDWYSAKSVYEYVAESVPRARINPWLGVRRPLIICESRTTGGVFARGVAYQYMVPVAPTNGQVGGFLVTDVAPVLTDEETRVLYVGDHDLAGDQIEANTRRVLERHTGRIFDEETWERVALTANQVAKLAARGVEPIRKTDARYNDRRPHEAYECEALKQGPLVKMLRSRLDDLLPQPLSAVQERERRERDKGLFCRRSPGRRQITLSISCGAIRATRFNWSAPVGQK